MNQPDPNKAGASIIEAVKSQLEANDPPKVKETFNRLRSLGISRSETLKHIACALSVEIFGAIRDGQEFDPERYDENLDKLPEMPWDDE
ncbi:hypothetical protein OAP14_11580 [Aliiglaciecola sp.]|nr:hypothetical protein [Aliiglaciecola sp.]